VATSSSCGEIERHVRIVAPAGARVHAVPAGAEDGWQASDEATARAAERALRQEQRAVSISDISDDAFCATPATSRRTDWERVIDDT